MLNRRHLRVKVLQILYAYTQSPDKQIAKFEKQLLKNVDQVYEMYIWLLNLLVDVCEYSVVDAEERANKLLPSEEDRNINTRLADNTFIDLLRRNESFIDATKKYHVSWGFDPEIVRQLFQELRKTEEYAGYLKSDDRSLSVEKDMIKFIFKKLISKTPAVEQSFEERFINWPLDREVLQAMVAKTLKNFTSDNPNENALAQLTPNWSDDKDFIVDLFDSTVRYGSDYQQLIADRTKNWKSERIALMDNLLMQLAISELIQFSNIPIKVTINEYIEISKDFSTPKSNTFINGILDNILYDLKQSGRIHKYGRGLME